MIIVIDSETTGIDAAKDSVVEIAAVPLTRIIQHPEGESNSVWHVGRGHSSLVAPGRRVPPAARAVHHLSDEELRSAPKLTNAIVEVLLGTAVDVLDLTQDADYNKIECIACHNAEFDAGFLRATVEYAMGRVVPWLCTWRCALHLYPDVEVYSNQGLRYALPGVNEDLSPSLPADLLPHRALYDAVTTAFLLRRMLQERSLGELLELQTHPVLQKTCRFGKHRGVPWAEVPVDYLRWTLRANPPFDRDVEHTARHYLNR